MQVRRPTLADIFAARREAAGARAEHRRVIARLLALTSALAVLAAPFLSWWLWLLGVALGSRSVWVWLQAAGDAFEADDLGELPGPL